MRLNRTAVAATILATAASTIAAGSSLPTAQAIQTQVRGADDGTVQDSRLGSPLVRPTKDRISAVRELVGRAGVGTRVTWDDRFGTPRTIYPAAGQALSGPHDGSAVEAARAFVADNRAAFGLSAADVSGLRVTRNHELTGVDVTVVDLAQTFGGVTATRGGSVGLAVDSAGRVLAVTASVTPKTSVVGSYLLSPTLALTKAASSLGVTISPTAAGDVAGFTKFKTGLAGASYVEKTAFPTADGAQAAYRVLLVSKLDEAWDMVVDAGSGKVLY